MSPSPVDGYLSRKLLITVSIVTIVVVIVLFSLSFGTGVAGTKYTLRESPRPVIVDHSEAFKALNITKYEGSKSCLPCHREAVLDVFHSYHYQLQNYVDDVYGIGRVLVGSKNIYNDFCGAIFWQGEVPINFIGNATLKKPPKGFEEYKGRFIASGCSMCHGVSLGAVPSENVSEEQLTNIDCLVCHSTKYKGGPIGIKEGWRILVKTDNGFRYIPNPEIDVEELAATITSTPTKDSCLYCHAFSGGGPGFKRPNLGPELLGNVSKDVDVHMAMGLECIDCHIAENHDFRLRSSDTWSRRGGITVSCIDCHEDRHRSFLIGWFIETFHINKVACQTCHIPVIASRTPTDVRRDWSEVEFKENLLRYEPKIVLEGNVTPVYLWWNEKERYAYIYPNPVEVTENNSVILSMPVGSKEDGKIYPYKYHEAVVPFDSSKKLPIPIKVGVVFATGNNTLAFTLGGKPGGLQFSGDYITLVRYMAVNHGVKPSNEALGCFDCHGIWDTRMDWVALGYGIYPKIYFGTIIALIIVGVAIVVYLLYRRLVAG